MKYPALLRAVPTCLLCLALLTAAHAKPVRNGAVEAELVPAVTSVQPGHAFDVALRLAHDPHWHTYWINSGTGYPTSIKWTLPPGWQAGDIQWPVPHVLTDAHGTITGNGYDGEVFLFVTLTPPADLSPGLSVTLKAAVAWLMCKEVCEPGEAALELTLPVDTGLPAPHPRWGAQLAAARGQLPHAPDGWQLAAARDDRTVTLTVHAPAGAVFTPADFHFFADDGFIAYDQPQPIRAGENGAFGLTLSIDPAGPKNPTRLFGVLALANGAVPGIRVEVPFSTPPSTFALRPSTAVAGGLPGTLVLAFLGGLILNLMPCVFPVLGIKILGFVNQAGADRRKVTLHGLVFALGVLVSFWVLAGALIALRAGGRELGWGFQLQEPGFVFVLAALLLIFALNLSGLFEFGLSATGVGAQLQMKSGYTGSFFTGVLATVVATPCSAPFLAPALGAALALSPVESIAVFTAIALGLAVPYLLLSAFPAAVKFLPRPGAWMETFKQLMAFPLYATAGFLVWVLAGQTPDTGLLKVLFGLVLVAMAAWAYGRWTQHGGSAGRRASAMCSPRCCWRAAWLWAGRVRRISCGRSGAPRPWRNCAPRGRRSMSTSPRAGAPPARATRRWCSRRRRCATRCARTAWCCSRPTGPAAIRRSPRRWRRSTAARCPSISSTRPVAPTRSSCPNSSPPTPFSTRWRRRRQRSE